MRKRLNIMRGSAKRFRRLALAIAVATVILAIAAVTVISRQNGRVKEASSNQAKTAPPATTTTAPVAANRNYVTVKVAGQNVQVDSQTGQIKELTPEEAQRMAAGLKQELNRSTEGLVQVQQPDGSVEMDLQGRFQNVVVAKVNEDGTVTESCVDNAQAAGQFFGIDPKLIDDQSTSSSKAVKKQPRVTTPRN